jgi:hypothetical protein
MTDQGHGHGGHGPPATTGKHGMLVVGLDSIMGSHLPMFHPPHDFQLLVGIDFDGAETYRRDRLASREPVYTLDPEHLPWSDLLPTGSEPPRRSSFRADVYRGHFERQGTKIVEGTTVAVRSIHFFAQLSAAEAPSDEITYRAVGLGGDDLVLVHEIRGAPNFDQVLRCRFVDPDFAGLQPTGAPVVIRDRADSVEERLRAASSVSGLFPQTIGPTGQHGFTTQLDVIEEVYLEVGELKG